MHQDVFIKGKHVDLIALSENIVLESRWYAWFNDETLTYGMQKHNFPNSVDQQLTYYKNTIAGSTDRLQLGIVAHSQDSLLGIISLNNIDYINRKAEISMLMGEPEGRTMNRTLESMKLLLNHGFHSLNLRRIYGGTIIEEWALLLCRTLAFQREGVFRQDVYKNGEYRDVFLVASLRSDFNKSGNLLNPGEPRQGNE